MNVIVYVLDQLRPDFLSCYGFGRETSPNIDALALDGVCFKNAYATSSWTKPSCASLLTGQYPRAINMLRPLDHLPPQVPTLQEMLGRGGFSCSPVKWFGKDSPKKQSRSVNQRRQCRQLFVGPHPESGLVEKWKNYAH